MEPLPLPSAVPSAGHSGATEVCSLRSGERVVRGQHSWHVPSVCVRGRVCFASSDPETGAPPGPLSGRGARVAGGSPAAQTRVCWAEALQFCSVLRAPAAGERRGPVKHVVTLAQKGREFLPPDRRQLKEKKNHVSKTATFSF